MPDGTYIKLNNSKLVCSTICCSGTEAGQLHPSVQQRSRPLSLPPFEENPNRGVSSTAPQTFNCPSKPESMACNLGNTSISVPKRVADGPQLRRNVSVSNTDRSSVHLYRRSYCKYCKGGSKLPLSPSHFSYTLLCSFLC